MKDDILHAPLPAGPAGQYGMHLMQSDMLMKYSKNQDAAKEFLKWIHTEKNYEKWFLSQKGYATPCYAKWEEHKLWKEDPVLEPFKVAAKLGQAPGHAGPPTVKAAEALSIDPDAPLVRCNERRRLTLAPCGAEYALRGFLHLAWGADVRVERLLPVQRLPLLLDHRRVGGRGDTLMTNKPLIALACEPVEVSELTGRQENIEFRLPPELTDGRPMARAAAKV